MGDITIDIVFDGPPGPESGRFVEVEDATGRSIRIGEWIETGGLWRLRLPDPRALLAEIERLRADLVKAQREAFLFGVGMMGMCGYTPHEAQAEAACRYPGAQ